MKLSSFLYYYVTHTSKGANPSLVRQLATPCFLLIVGVTEPNLLSQYHHYIRINASESQFASLPDKWVSSNDRHPDALTLEGGV